jgi:hypothetical protein
VFASRQTDTRLPGSMKMSALSGWKNSKGEE